PKKGTITLACTKDMNSSTILFQDSGIGMSQDKIEAMMQDRFVESTMGTAGETGTGLGLKICNEFTQKQQGKLVIENGSMGGTIIKVSLPNK
ncbi:MAG TPA: ATP-binding protein, partial [Prolixibacteraceae bacterium]|nr:ATP-binding protein [Prolixibacteraceae bacterium]